MLSFTLASSQLAPALRVRGRTLIGTLAHPGRHAGSRSTLCHFGPRARTACGSRLPRHLASPLSAAERHRLLDTFPVEPSGSWSNCQITRGILKSSNLPRHHFNISSADTLPPSAACTVTATTCPHTLS